MLHSSQSKFSKTDSFTLSIEFNYRKCMVSTVVSNSKYGSKSTGSSIQLPKLFSLFNLGQTQLRLIMCSFNLMKAKEIDEINNNRNLRLGVTTLLCLTKQELSQTI